MSETTTTENQTMSDADIDSTYDALMNGNPTPDIDEAVPDQVEAKGEKPAEVSAPVIKFMHKGKEIVAPLSDKRVQQWLAQGYDYSSNTQALRQQQAEFEQQRKQIEALKEQYGPVDDWVKQNPAAWQKIVEQFQGQAQGLTGEIDPNNPLFQHVQQLQQELASLKPQLNEVLTERQAQLAKQQDEALEADIKSVAQEYGLDLEAPEDDGSSKMLKVLEHATKNGIKNFRTAFVDLYHKDLLKQAEERGKESLAKERQKQTKLGLLGTSQAPSKGVKSAKDYKAKSYDQLIQEGLEELGIA